MDPVNEPPTNREEKTVSSLSSGQSRESETGMPVPKTEEHQAQPVQVPISSSQTPSTLPAGPPQQSGWQDWPTAAWTIWHTLGLLIIIGAIGALGWGLGKQPLKVFPVTLLLLTIFATIAGHGTVGLWRGLLIDERNRMSLSRLQMVLWTIVVLSGFLVAVLWNIVNGNDTPLKIAVQGELWLLLGISTTSVVASPLILSTKKTEPPKTALPLEVAEKKQEESQRTFSGLEAQGLPPNDVTTQGKIVVWRWPQDARLADLFQGDEIGNAAHLDLGKVQMFYFTLILVLAYIAMLAYTFLDPPAYIRKLPEFDAGMVALLAISHAGYLANKAIPHSVS